MVIAFFVVALGWAALKALEPSWASDAINYTANLLLTAVMAVFVSLHLPIWQIRSDSAAGEAAQVPQLQKALRPFAKAYDPSYTTTNKGQQEARDSQLIAQNLTVGDLRRAYETLESANWPGDF